MDPGTHTVYVTNADEQHGVGDRRGDAHRHRHRARRRAARGGGGPGDPHRLRRQLRRQHGVGDRRGDATPSPPPSVGEHPQAMAVDPGTHTVYVVNANDNTVSVIDRPRDTVTATVPVGKNLRAVAVDPGTRTVYVTNQDDERCR